MRPAVLCNIRRRRGRKEYSCCQSGSTAVRYGKEGPSCGSEYQKSPSGQYVLHSVDYSRTLNALYKGETDPLEAVISLTGYLDLLPSVLERNAIPMDGQVFDFIRGLEKDYDYVIIDTPSVGQVSDVLSLNQIAQAVLL